MYKGDVSHYQGAYTTEDLFCGTGFPQRLENCPVEMFLKLQFMGKIFPNTPWPVVTLIIHNVSFCIFNIIVRSSLEYFSLV